MITIASSDIVTIGTQLNYNSYLSFNKQLLPFYRLIVCGMTPKNFKIADYNDAGMLDIVGFNTHSPHLIQEFVLGFQ